MNMTSFEELIPRGRRWLEGHGGLMLNIQGELSCCPATLYPSPIPETGMRELLDIQPVFNTLVDDVSRDHTFLCEVFEKMNDAFSKRLFHMYLEVHREGSVKPAVLGLHRSDYMLQTPLGHSSLSSTCTSPEQRQPIIPAYIERAGQQRVDGDGTDETAILAECQYKQIEINTISASFGGLASVMPPFHRYMAGWICQKTNATLTHTMPDNGVMSGYAKGLAAAWKAYGAENGIVLMVTDANERNIFDQNMIENALMTEHCIRLRKVQFSDLHRHGRLDKETRRFYMWDNVEVSVVYWRSGWSPDHYPTEQEWSTRMVLERSRSVVCPSIAYQLVGAKKVQQLLADPAILSRFVRDDGKLSRLQRVFAKLYSLDQGMEGDKAAALAMENPSRFVMKPQREGGGNNLYDDDIRQELLRLADSSERGDYILMERVVSPAFTNYFLGGGRPVTESPSRVDAVNEVGIYGIFVRSETDGDSPAVNESAGHLIRTKSVTEKEGGIMVASSSVGSALLVAPPAIS